MNRDKIVEIATALPREAYIDLLCAGCYALWREPEIEYTLNEYKNMSYNQVMNLIEAYNEEGKEEEDE